MENNSAHREDSKTSLLELREREKELDFVYSLAALLSGTDLNGSLVAGKAADQFRKALTRPDLAEVQVGINGHTAISSDSPGTSFEGETKSLQRISAAVADVCWLEARYLDGSMSFSEREAALGESTTRLLGISARRMLSDLCDSALKQELERKNAALSELISRIELEKKTIRDSIAARLQDSLLPLLEQMDKAGLPSKFSAEIRRELGKAVSGSRDEYLSLRSLLSSRELEVCSLVADGLSSKEIAIRLGLAISTVERHRHNARRKLGMPARQGSLGAVHLGAVHLGAVHLGADL